MAQPHQQQRQQKPPVPPRTRSILVLGAGELGQAILSNILSHPSFSPANTSLSLLIRPSSLAYPSPAQQSQHALLRSRGVAVIPGDIEASSQSALAELFAPFTAVLHAGGMALPSGTMTKVTRAVLEARVPYYVPWQHGVDYDIIGREGGQGMFSEQIGVRELLRGQTTTDWVVLSCGIFMSFLFEDFWGVVRRLPPVSAPAPAPAPAPAAEDSSGTAGVSASIRTSNSASENDAGRAREQIQVTALNSWDDLITATTAEDIGKCTAELLFTPDSPVNTPVYIAGDTLSYGAFADTIERVVAPLGMEVVRQVWPLSYLKEESRIDPADKIKRYRVVFAEGKGLSWPKEQTWSAKQGITMVGVEEYARSLFVCTVDHCR
ncbi:uncharacterized protein Z519_06400 [Cladophialophora bantiana CBS 173.52]|uniref:NmrA-like domain-containing protein n=1 Tax=Cladophialophora bantiana (strain ATCC 10958 / CBS 173.52 / CDC B-1940 / NIH 8579) TaxID=1442370 RepID=A0A0D2HH25_CLAB1|nr:uncharacterized protein Z519_06400 [Cladophialophora bantiana CBS 173.52]KIW92553.1 hypothetical protein Z519_06400 [Cladophialophora bantiana CBS 173.52]